MSDIENKPGASASDYLANERTFLAWIRTSIAIMGFGFVVVKFALFIKQISLVLAGRQTVLLSRGYSTQIGILLVGIGAFLALYSFLRYHNTAKQLANSAYKPSSLPSLLLTMAIVVVGILLVIYLIPNL
jgi:putative membrane protein